MTKIKGFTLIELLVSTALLSMIIVVCTVAFGLFADRWDGRLGHFDRTLRSSQYAILVQDVLDSLVPYVAYGRDGWPVVFFEGNRNGFVAVSSKSLFSYGHFAVVRFSVRQHDDSRFDVIYEEWPMDSEVLVSSGEPLDFSEPLVLFAGVTEPLFSYFGWPDVAERSAIDDQISMPPRWSATYDGVQALRAPLKANLSFTTPLGSYRIVSAVTSKSRGVLGRYKRQKFRGSGEVVERDDDDCAC